DINASYYIKGLTSSKLEELRKANIDEFMENITAIVDKLEGYGVEVILCTPTPYDDATDTTSEKSVGLGMCAERLRELAQERDLKVIDHFANMYPLRSQKYWGPDYIHPNKLGQHVMAQSVMYSLGYIDKMDVDTAMSSFSEENAKISTMAYNFQMMIMTERSLRAQGYADVAARKARATELRNSDQTSDMYKWIYQNYLDLIDNAIETREEIINLTEEMSYKD
ncbi:MAG: hypothetical protein J6K12_07410, partial [Clostridia bacterium]|nr:hypothetical protein [Clostridia bacterium]